MMKRVMADYKNSILCNTQKKYTCIAAIVAWFAVPGLCSTVIIGDFEGSLDGWSSSGSASGTTLSSSTTGVTEGSGSLQGVETTPPTTSWGAFEKGAMQNNTEAIDALSAPDGALTVDFQAALADVPAGSMNLLMLVNGSHGGSEQSAAQAVTLDGTSRTYTFPLSTSQKQIVTDSTTWLKVGFSITSADGRTWYADNIQAVGTPGSPPVVPEGVFGDFEGGSLDDWDSSGSATNTSLSTSTMGVTLNSGSLQVTDSAGGLAWGAVEKSVFGNSEIIAFLTATNGAVSIDVLAQVADIPAGSMTLKAVVYGDGGNESSSDMAVTIDGTSRTMTFELSQNQKDILANSATWARVGFSSNSGDTRTWYVDNIRALGTPDTNSPPAETRPALLYDDWIAPHTTVCQALESNLYDYAIGGNPTNPATTDHHPTIDCCSGGEHIDYVFIARKDAEARGLVYTVETTDDLLEGSWTNEGYTVVGSGDIDSAFTAVTNRPYTLDTMFLRLKVEAQFTWAGPDALDDYGGLQSLAFDLPSNNFFRTTFTNGQWWLVTPQNHAYLSFGLNHFHAALWRKDWNRSHWETEFAGTAYSTEWKEAFYNHAREMSELVGANSLGYHNEEAILLDRPPLMPYYRQYMPVEISSHHNAPVEDYLDIFAPEFVTHCADKAQEQVAPYTNDTMIIGYTMTDIPFITEKRSLDAGRPTWAMALRNLPASAPGKQAYVTLIQSRYATIGDFNTVYGTTFGYWTNLENAVDWRPTSVQTNETEIADQNAFNRLCIDKYYEVAEAAFRAVDQNHLFIGDKLQANMSYSDELELMIDVAKDYVDILLYQFFGHDRQFGGYQSNIQNDIAGWSNLPMMNGDGGFGAKDDPVNMPNPQTPAAETQEERAQWLIEYAEDAFSHPNFVGWHICGVIDGWNTWGTQKPGVMNALGVVHTNVTDALKNVSLDLYNYRGN